MNSLRARFGNAIAWNFLATLALQGGTFLTNLCVANLMGAASFGKFGLVISTAQTVGALLQLSTGIAANKYIAQYRVTEPQFAAAVLAFCSRISYAAGGAGMTALLFGAFFVNGTTHQLASLGLELAIAAPVVFCSVLVGFQTGALAGLEGFSRSARLLIPLMVLQVVSTSYAAFRYGLDGALLAMSVNFVLRTLAAARLLSTEARRKGLGEARSDNGRLRRVFVTFMLPGALTGLTTMPALWFASATLAATPGGFTSLGVFNAAYAIRGILMIFPWIVSTVGFTLLSAHLKLGQERHFRRVMWANLGLSLAAIGVGGCIVLLAGEHILSAYGTGFKAGKTVLQILMLSLLGEALALPLYQALASRGRMWSSFLLIMLPRDLAIAVLGWAFVRSSGAEGLAWVHSAAWVYALLACGGLLAVDLQRQQSS